MREGAKHKVGKFERRFLELDMRQILTGSRYAQTNGKIARLYGEIRLKLSRFESIMMRTSGPIDLSIKWYNYDRLHMLLN